jgi:GTPase SAR1 family protein
VIVVYDITRAHSYMALEKNWIEPLISTSPRKNQLPLIQAVLVANKTELVDLRMASTQKGKGLRRKYQHQYEEAINFLEYIECSARKNINIDIIFETLIKGYLSELEDNGFTLTMIMKYYKIFFGILEKH